MTTSVTCRNQQHVPMDFRNQVHACVLCSKTFARSRIAGSEVQDGVDFENIVCSALCKNTLRLMIQAFVHGFLLSSALCSILGKTKRLIPKKKISHGDIPLQMYNANNVETINAESIQISSLVSLPSTISDSVLYTGQKNLSHAQTNEPGNNNTDEFALPIHFGVEIDQHQGINSQYKQQSKTEADNFSLAGKNSELLFNSNPQPDLTEQRSMNSEGKIAHPELTFVSVNNCQLTTTRSAAKRKLPRKSLSRRARLKKSDSSLAETALATAEEAAAKCLKPRQPAGFQKGFCLKPITCHNCVYCSEAFSSKHRLKLHIKSHHSIRACSNSEAKKSITCEFCARSFMYSYSLKTHIKRNHSGEKTVHCDICGKAQLGTFALIAHKKACHDFSSLCHVCGAEFSGRTSFNKHMIGHAGIKRYFCDVCGKGFVYNSSLNNHKVVHMTNKSLQCDVCSQMFKVRSLLNEHLLKFHHCGPSLDHRICGLRKMGVDIDQAAIKRHINHQCLVCGEQLVSGMCPLHPDNKQEVFQCPTCGDQTNNIILFYHHIKWHQGKLMSSKRRKGLRKDFPVSLHLASSGSGTTASHISCEVCTKTFKNFESLSAHMHQHREARFSCNICSKRFTYKCNLKTHMSIHQETWQFECDVCKKNFRHKYALKKHQEKHTEPQFKCQICSKALTRKQYLVRHYQKMHPEHQLITQS